MRALENEIKKSKFFIVIDSFGHEANVRKAQITLAKERGAKVLSYVFSYPQDFVLHLNSLRFFYKKVRSN